MTTDNVIDKVLVEWGDSLFRRRRGAEEDEGPKGSGRLGSRSGSGGQGRAGTASADVSGRMSANAVRRAIRDSIRPGAKQVVVKITGGGKGFKAMSAHLRYISRQGKEEVGGRGRTLEVTDERGERHEGSAAIRRLMDDWRISGSYIADDSPRKEAFHIIFSMPQGTQAEALQKSVEATAARLFEGHRYAMAMHLDQGAPHVHVMVRAEHLDGVRLNPRKADLDRWRATFARELQARGIDAIATRQVSRARNRAQPQLWQVKAREQGRLQRERKTIKTGAKAELARREAFFAWRQLTEALARSPDLSDRALALDAARYLAQQAGIDSDKARDPKPDRDAPQPRPSDRREVGREPSPERPRPRDVDRGSR